MTRVRAKREVERQPSSSRSDTRRSTALAAPAYGIELADRRGENRTGLPGSLKANTEALSSLDLSDVRVRRDSPAPAQVNALAYTQGTEIHLGPGQDQSLPHELWHVVQQKQGRVREGGINQDAALEREADRMGARALGPVPAGLLQGARSAGRAPVGASAPIQRQVRIGGGATRVNEAQYQVGRPKAAIGPRVLVRNLIADGVKRVFNDEAELEAYANGRTDYIGDVATATAGTFWYRLPRNRLTVLGEFHQNPAGNVEDVILGLGTSRFMYEPFNMVRTLPALPVAFAGTQARVNTVHAGLAPAPRVNRAAFNPDLEDIVFKALAGSLITRNEYIAAGPATMTAGQQAQWRGRPSISAYSYGERTALYLAIAIHIASDLSAHNFGRVNYVESPYVMRARHLVNFYLANRAVLDLFMRTKDADDLIGIYELTSPGNFANLNIIREFTLHFHRYATEYIEQLGSRLGNAALEGQGRALSGNLTANLDAVSPAREEVMWERVMQARAGGYLLVGMGNAHRTNLSGRLTAAGIPHEEVRASLTAQRAAVNSGWVP